MNTYMVIILFIVGIVLTVKGGDWFVDAATWLAEATGIPKFIIGATVVSLATTLPELLVSSFATASGSIGIAIGNAVGSVNCNTGLILALSAVFMAGAVDMKQFRNKGILFIAACALLTFFSRNGEFTLVGAGAMFLVLVLFTADSLHAGKEEETEKEERPEMSREEITKNLALFVFGAAGMALGARLMVDNGSELARMLHVPETIIGLTLVALGTSLPELVTAITAIVKHQSDISVGNILGANVLDMCMVVPVSSIISFLTTGKALPVDMENVMIHMPMSLGLACVAVVPTLLTKRTNRWQGILLIAAYLIYIIAVSFFL
jgi:cation:H+ antiporter